MKIEKLQPGQVVYDVGKTRMGNTTLTTVSVWPVTIVSVDLERGTVIARWNGNSERKYRASQIAKWRTSKPLLIKSGFGIMRLATRAEISAHKSATAPET
ncbi:hypothetical protein ACQHIH_21720 (plasmid) [Xanthomonas sontii]|uniref:Uncharacterized protein n=1 Tax=Xanthomonas sacchari TaxID=56458 RepID=A0ABT3DUR8_9XANT|nr:hypothetical protein [Xanthomonas sacchari]MCW0399243.1 hypothetical protein [Xanthomonas sacchari]